MLNWELILYIIAVIVFFVAVLMIVFYFRSRKASKKQQDHFRQVHLNIAKNKKCMFGNGLYGKIVDVNEDTVDVQVKSGAVITVSRYAISSVED